MTDRQSTLEKLNAFRQLDKFSNSAWNERGLNPSDSDMCSRLESLFNNCTDNLINAIGTGQNSTKLKNILKRELRNFKSFDYDTEEREFICDYFFQLSNIIEVDFKTNLNNWLYGRGLNYIIKVISFFKAREKVIETLSQNCTSCDLKLETYIFKKEDGIPDYNWTIIQCNNCREYNLLSTGPNIKELRFGNYKSVEQLPKTEFTEELAKQRLEQIRFFRK
jgi:hypothetical protein